MSYLTDALAAWEAGPYAMQAIIGCAIPTRGEWFVQLRAPAERLFDQVILSNATGSSREEAIDKAMKHAGVDEIIEWSPRKTWAPPPPAPPPYRSPGLRSVMFDCEMAIEGLCRVVNLMHDEI